VRLLLLTPAILGLAACSSLSVPNTMEYVDPLAGPDRAILVKEYCLGQGRGLVHFDGIDGNRFPAYKMQRLQVQPGTRVVKLFYMAPGASFNVEAHGELMSVTHDFAPNGAYIVRYRRTDPKHYRMWIEPIDPARAQTPNTVCLQPAFEDPTYWH
jgi:hypothetical protein